jgi:hypothetical protein
MLGSMNTPTYHYCLDEPLVRRDDEHKLYVPVRRDDEHTRYLPQGQ